MGMKADLSRYSQLGFYVGMKADRTGLSEKFVTCSSNADFSEGQMNGSALAW